MHLAALLAVALANGDGQQDSMAIATMDDIRKRVAVAGGETEGFLVFSLSWASADDLDLHVKIPGGKSIYANNPRAENRRGKLIGELDVDMCLTPNTCAQKPVENIVFRRTVPVGRYQVVVRNYNYRGLNGHDRVVPFDLMVRFGRIGHGGQVKRKLFEGLCTGAGLTGEASDVLVYEFKYSSKNLGTIVETKQTSADDLQCDVGARISNSTCSKTNAETSSSTRNIGSASSTKSRSAKKASKWSKVKHYTLNELEVMRVGSIKRAIKDHSGVCRGCVEKSEFIQ
jgi:hypothetical protein